MLEFGALLCGLGWVYEHDCQMGRLAEVDETRESTAPPPVASISPPDKGDDAE